MTVPPAHAQASQATCRQSCRIYTIVVSPFCVTLPGLNRFRCAAGVVVAQRMCRQACSRGTAVAAAAIPATTTRSPGRGPY